MPETTKLAPDGCPDWVWAVVLSARDKYLRTPRHLRPALGTPGNVAVFLGEYTVGLLARNGQWPLSADLLDSMMGPPSS